MTPVRFFVFVFVSSLVVAGCTQNNSTSNMDAGPISVMSFNIRYNNPADSIHAWPHRKERFASTIRFSEADIVGVQEALHGQLVDLDSLLPGYGRLGVGRDDGKDQGEYTAILYREDRIRVDSSGTFWLSTTPDVVASKDWDAAITRIATWARVTDLISGEPFLVMNTHFDHVGQTARENSADLLLDKLDELSSDGPVVLMGDFNVTPDNPVYTRLTSRLNDAMAVSERVHHGPEHTYYGGFEVTHEPGRRIDYIFVNDAVRVHKHAILSDNWNGAFASDHLAVVAVVAWVGQ